jgi:uncharacterized protein (DUF924 family)
MSPLDPARTAAQILDYWFATLDNDAPLDPEREPFRSCYARWYGKTAEVDADVRTRFEPLLLRVTQDGAQWERELEAWRAVPRGLLALVILLDQFPRNMYRDTPRMYAHDGLALATATLAARELDVADLPLVHRMFLHVPLMHVEDATLQQMMVQRFEQLAELAAVQSPRNVRFFELALRSARRHCEVVEQFGRFPHRNEILGRRSTPDELVFLERDDARF